MTKPKAKKINYIAFQMSDHPIAMQEAVGFETFEEMDSYLDYHLGNHGPDSDFLWKNTIIARVRPAE